MTDEHLFQLMRAGACEAMETCKSQESLIRVDTALAYFTGIHQATMLLMMYDGDVVAHRMNKVLREGLKSLGIEIVVPEPKKES